MASLPLVQIFDSNGDELKQLEQWDSDRVLEFRGIDPFTLADIDVIHVGVVGHLNSPEAVPQVREDENSIKITLPGWKFTRYGQPLIFYGYEQMGAGELRTVFAVTMPLARRLKPVSYSDAEWERQQNELERQANEAERIANEQDRVAAEQARVDAELARQSAEDERIANEQERIAHGTLFIADYDRTTFAEIKDALGENKAVICRKTELFPDPFNPETIRIERTEGILTENWNNAYQFLAYPYKFRVNDHDEWTTLDMVDYEPTASSTNLVTSAGVYNALQDAGKEPLKVTITQSGGGFTTDYSSAEIAAAWAEGRYVYAQFERSILALGTTPSAAACIFQLSGGGIAYRQFTVSGNAAVQVQRNIISSDSGAAHNTINSTLLLNYTIDNDKEAVNKEYVDGALDDKQDVLTFDDAPTEGSTNPVTSDGIYAALQNIDTSDLVDPTLTIAGKAADAEVVGLKFDEILEDEWNFSHTIPESALVYYRGKNVRPGTHDMVDNPSYSCIAFQVPATGYYRVAFSPSNLSQCVSWVYDSTGIYDDEHFLRSVTNPIKTPQGVLLNEGEHLISRAFSLTFTYSSVEYATDVIARLEHTLPLTSTMTQQVETLLSGKQNTLTWDTTPTAGSLNPVTSNGIYAALDTKVDTVTGKGLSANDYTNIDKAKVDNMPTATSDLTNDSDFQTATDVQDAITDALGSMTSLQYEIVTTLPATGAAGTVYLINNGGDVYEQYMWIGGAWHSLGTTAIDLSNYYTMAQTDTRLAAKQDALTFDNAPTVSSTNPVTSGGVFNALAAKQDTLVYDNVPTADSVNAMSSGGIYNALRNKQDTLTFDPTPTNNSPNPVTSGGVWTALGFKQDVLVFDSIPTLGSPNPVTSAGVWSALRNKQDAFDFDTAPLRGSLNAVTSNGIYEALQGRTTPAQVQQAINDAMADFTEFDYAIVAALPAVGEKGVVYFVPDAQNPSISNQYLWIEETPSGHYEQIGSTAVDLSDYYTKDEVDDLIDEVRVFEAQINVTSAADIIQAVNDRKSIVVHSGAGSPSEFAVKAAISGTKVYLYTMTLNVGSSRSYPVFTRHVIEDTAWAVTNVAGAAGDDVPFIAEYGRTTPPQIEMATAKNRIIVVKTTTGDYFPCINVSTTADYHTRLHCLVGSYDATATTFGLALKIYDIYGATWTEYSTDMVTAADLQDAVDELNDRIDEVEATIGRFRGNFGTKAALDAWSGTARENDFVIVLADETLGGECWCYGWSTGSSPAQWVPHYKIRDAAFTQAQLNAINSGITAAKVAEIDNKVDKVTTSGKTEVYIHNGATQTVREIATGITSASADATKLPTVAAVYNNRRLNGVAADAGSTALDFDALLAKCGLTNLGAGYAWAYCRQFNSCTDKPFSADAVYIEVWGRDNSTFLVHVVDWIAQKDAWRTKNNGTWNTTWNLMNNRASGSSAVSYTNYSANFSTMGDYSGITRQAWRSGSMAGVAFHLQCKCATACSSNWYYIGTVAEGFRPTARVAITCNMWSVTGGGVAVGGDIDTNGRIRVWINTLGANDNTQFRVNASWMIN